MQDKKKAKAKSQNLPRRARKARSSGSVRMPGKPRSRETTQPMARSTQKHDPTVFSEGAVNHPRFGRGQRFVGNQMLTNAVTTASDSQLWTGTAPTTVASINTIKVSPDIFNSRLALFAQTYARYRFVAIDVIYEPLVASTAVGGFALAIVPDSMVDGTATYSYSATQEISPSVVSPFREKCTLSYRVPLSNDELWYMEYDGTSTAGARMTAQFALLGYPSSSSLGAITQGTFRLRYAIEMYNPVSSEGIVGLLRTTQAERKVLLQVLERVREEKSSDSKESKQTKSTTTVDLSKVPLEKSGIVAPPTTPIGSGSSSTLSSGTVSSGWFRVN